MDKVISKKLFLLLMFTYAFSNVAVSDIYFYLPVRWPFMTRLCWSVSLIKLVPFLLAYSSSMYTCIFHDVDFRFPSLVKVHMPLTICLRLRLHVAFKNARFLPAFLGPFYTCIGQTHPNAITRMLDKILMSRMLAMPFWPF